ncbi:MAG TPA: DUF2975 domain-containing protein [Clostridium sp.]|nr:DUF2975 domain-containing protein [Clostridium sp.]
MEKTIGSKILNILVVLGILLTLLGLLGTPLITTAFFKSAFSQPNSPLIIVIVSCIYLCAIPYIIALLKLKKLCKLIGENDLFSIDATKSLRTISICAFSEIILFNGCSAYLIYVHDMFLYALSIVSMIIITFISLVIGFLALVSAHFLEQTTNS